MRWIVHTMFLEKRGVYTPRICSNGVTRHHCTLLDRDQRKYRLVTDSSEEVPSTAAPKNQGRGEDVLA